MEVKELNLTRDLNFYNNCREAASQDDLTIAIQSYAMIASESTVPVAHDWVNTLLHQDGKNRKIISDVYGGSLDTGGTEDTEVDKYYQLALVIAFNQFLSEVRESLYYELYATTIVIFLISEGKKEMVDDLELPDPVRTRSNEVLLELDDRILSLVQEARQKFKELQPELSEKADDLGINLINESTSTVSARWFTTELGVKELSDDMYVAIQGLRTEYLRYVKRNGKVELNTLLNLFGVTQTTYGRYKKDMISKVIPRCDSASLNYVKHLLLNRDD